MSSFRAFDDSGAVVIEEGRRVVVYFDRRSHNPILREAKLDAGGVKIPWLPGHRLEFVYV